MKTSAASFRPVDPAVVRRAKALAERSSFKSALGAVLRTLAAAAVSAALSLGIWQGWRWATASPFFALREIHFTGLVHAGETELTRRSGLLAGENLFRADLPRAARALGTHPWVANVRIERRLPGRLDISVEEHHPAALVQAGPLYVLDDEGRLFKRAAPEDGLDLPLITGFSRDAWEERAPPATGGAQRAEHWRSRRPELQLRLLSALHLLDSWKVAGFNVSALSEVRLDEDGAFTLFAHDAPPGTADGGVQEIRLGAKDLALELRRLAQVRAALGRRGERATRIDLDNPARPDQAAATLADKR